MRTTRHHRIRIGALLPLVVATLLLAAPVAAEPAPPEGVTITVGGMPFPEGGSTIAGCAFDIVVEGLPGPEHSIGVSVEVVSPSVPEGSEAVLVDTSDTTAGPTWSTSIPMDDLVPPYERHPNGYHLRLAISIDGTSAGHHTYWLGCDEPQTGHPTRVQFLVEWHRLDDTVLAPPLDAVLPDGWRGALVLDAWSEKGTAVCTYEPGADAVTCTYDNPGHGDEPGLVVPGNPRATYDVALGGVPPGWAVDATTVGTFVGRETCPRGHEHEEPTAHEGEEPCFHTVIVDELELPPTSSSSTTTSAVLPASSVTPTSAAPTSTGATGTLPATGPTSAPLALVGLALLGAGSASLAVRRRLIGDGR